MPYDYRYSGYENQYTRQEPEHRPPQYVEDILEDRDYAVSLRREFYGCDEGQRASSAFRGAFLSFCQQQTGYPSLELMKAPKPAKAPYPKKSKVETEGEP